MNRLRVERLDVSGEARDFSGSGFLVQNPLLGGFVDGRLGRFQYLVGFFRGALGHGKPNIFDGIFNFRFDGFVPQPPNFILTFALYR